MPASEPNLFTQALCELIADTNGVYHLEILALFIKRIPISQDHDIIAEAWKARLALGPSLDDKDFGVLPALEKKKAETTV